MVPGPALGSLCICPPGWPRRRAPGPGTQRGVGVQWPDMRGEQAQGRPGGAGAAGSSPALAAWPEGQALREEDEA